MGVLSSLIVALTCRTDDFEAGLRGIEKSLDRTAKRVGDLGESLSIGMTAPIAGLGAASVAMSSQFGESFDKIVSLTKTSESEIGGLREAVLSLAGETAQSPMQLAEALRTIESAGLHGSQAVELLKDSAMAATAGLGTTQQVASIASSAINAYGASNLSATQAVSTLVASAREMKDGATQLLPAMSALFPMAATLKIPLSDLGGALALMTNNGMEAEKATAGLTRIMSMLEKPTSQSQAVLAQAGITFQDLRAAAGESGLSGVLKLLSNGFAGNDQAIAELFPNMRSMSAVFALIKGHANDTDDIFGRLSKTTGQTLNTAFNAVAQGPAFKFKQLMTDLQVVLIRIGDDILPTLIPLVEAFAAKVEAVSKWIAQLNPGTRDLIIVLAATAAAIGPILIGLGMMASSISTVLSFVGLLMGGFSAALIPLAAFAALAIEVGLVAGYILMHWRELKTDLGTIFDWLAEKIQATFGPIMAPLRKWMEDLGIVTDYLREKFGGILPSMDQVATAAKGLGAELKNDLATSFQSVLDAAGKMASGMLGSVQSAASGVKASVASVNTSVASMKTPTPPPAAAAQWGTFGSSLRGMWTQLTTDTDNKTSQMQSHLASLGNAGAAGLGKIAAGFITMKLSAGQALQQLIQLLIKTVAEMLIFAAVSALLPGAGGAAFAGGLSSGVGGGLGGMFGGRRAGGGDVQTGQSYWVGEKGPELFTPGASGAITPTAAISGGAKQVQVHAPIHIAGMDFSDPQAARQIIRSLGDEVKRGSQDAVLFAARTKNLADSNSGVSS